MKKFISLLCIFSLLFCLSVPIFAEDDDKDTGTGNGGTQTVDKDKTTTTTPTPTPTTGQTPEGTSGGGGGGSSTSSNGGPVLIVSKFSCGGDTVTAGKVFTLTYSLYNTNTKVAVKNVIVKITGGDTFALNKSADTYYVDQIKAKGTYEHSDQFVSKSETVDGSYPITITANYEYMESGAKTKGSSEVKLSIPLTQEERVNILNAKMGASDEQGGSVPVYVGEETPVEYNFINSGFSKLLNTELRLVNADSDEILAKAYIGTVNPSTQMNGSSYLKYTFKEAGDKNLKFVVYYEDAHLNVKTAEFAFKTTVEKMPEVTSAPVDEDSGNGFLWIGFLIIGGLVVLTIVIVVLRRRKKKRLSEDESLWDDEDEEDAGEDYGDEDDDDDADNEDDDDVEEDEKTSVKATEGSNEV